jgi:predicted nucleic acid-binding protein
VILLDTSGVLSALDAHEPRHVASARSLRAAGEPRLLSPFVLAELDYLLATRVSTSAARGFLEEVASGAYELAAFDGGDVGRATEILDRYQDVELGLADASIVVLAERYGTRDVLTLDERHFRAVSGRDGRPFRLLPANA